MKLGVVADVHGNLVALQSVLDDASTLGVERWWALGDLVLFGPRPVEVVQTLRELPHVDFVGGNTDRYVVTGDQPSVHPDAASVVGDVDLIQRFAWTAAGIAWAQAALVHAGLLDWLAELPADQRLDLPDGSRLLGVHASHHSDDGPGIDSRGSDEDLRQLLSGCEADIVIGGHTHDPTDRVVDGVRALNPGSTGLPRRSDGASWLFIDATEAGVTYEHRCCSFDIEAVVDDCRRRRQPNADFVEAILRRQHVYSR
jgi:predicted phosphodiesterase